MNQMISGSFNISKVKFRLLDLVYFLALLKFVLPFLIQNPLYEPHRDEFLYLDEARHMAWGYLEVPPIMSVLACFTNWMGGSLFWIKIWPSLFDMAMGTWISGGSSHEGITEPTTV